MTDAMTSRFTVDLEQLDHVIARIAGLVGFVEENLDELENRVAGLPASWTGKAATAHADAHRKWEAGAKDLREGLDAMRTAARQAHEQYTGAVSANLQMLGRGGAE
ncbi:WXG100 family type VII secretion target [Rhodococcus sp. PvR099]|uniref:WXG100 family type VII secretion target n=1 Tax=Rhodococcus sp. PvR099 TaxID=2806602 RepID=UPI001B53704A|nr:WXG100 family type VII secretion target [Rhodococcus sp. PvR099]MBP1159792.1 WXG100 family type VII secretion target [Rhodococcus sp. PvR099]